LAEEDEDFQTEFNRVFDNPEVKEADEDFTPDTFDNYLHMELSIDCDGERRLTSTASERPEQSKQPSKYMQKMGTHFGGMPSSKK
jgi:hypothetical protein